MKIEGWVEEIVEEMLRGKTTTGLSSAFIFEGTPQGHAFWAEYAYKRKPYDDNFETTLIHLQALQEE
jgi:hypothetical protein